MSREDEKMWEKDVCNGGFVWFLRRGGGILGLLWGVVVRVVLGGRLRWCEDQSGASWLGLSPGEGIWRLLVWRALSWRDLLGVRRRICGAHLCPLPYQLSALLDRLLFLTWTPPAWMM